jgi:2-succinyl-5-enolpyruvyl-6-hydroxy-3-cyclohexene-1-carboxylate synthase
VLDAGEWLLGDPEFVAAHRPEQVLCVGRPTLTRPVQRLLADPAVEVLAVQDGAAGYWAGDGVSAVGGTAAPPSRPADHEWLAHWRWVSGVARRAVDAVLDEPAPGTGPMSGLRLARDLAAALPDGALLVAGSSNPAREIGLAAAARDGVLLHANRGVGGIDGTISTAVGAALAHEAVAPGGHAVALLGDLTFLHDLTGLVIGPDEPRPDLVIVAADNAGGGIFSLLEQGAREHAAAFERVFGTPVRADLAALCRALDVPVDDLGESDGAEPGDRQQRLVDAIAPRPGSGLRVVRVPVDRAGLREHHARVRAAVRAALAGVPGL